MQDITERLRRTSVSDVRNLVLVDLENVGYLAPHLETLRRVAAGRAEVRAYTTQDHTQARYADVRVNSIEREAVDVKIVWDAAQFKSMHPAGRVLIVTEDQFALALNSIEPSVQHAAAAARLDRYWRPILGNVTTLQELYDALGIVVRGRSASRGRSQSRGRSWSRGAEARDPSVARAVPNPVQQPPTQGGERQRRMRGRSQSRGPIERGRSATPGPSMPAPVQQSQWVQTQGSYRNCLLCNVKVPLGQDPRIHLDGRRHRAATQLVSFVRGNACTLCQVQISGSTSNVSQHVWGARHIGLAAGAGVHIPVNGRR